MTTQVTRKHDQRNKLMSSVNRVRHALESQLAECLIKQLDVSAHTAQQAATALGCDVGQIVKSLVFKTSLDNQAVLALVGGDKRLDLEKLSAAVRQPLNKADAAFVKSETGFSIGGVAPVGSTRPLPVYMDQTLFRHSKVWAAAGHPKTVFQIAPELLKDISGATTLDLSQ